MQRKEGIGVFGGSFNPPLNSHFQLAEQIINELKFIEKILFVPVSCNYNKAGLVSNEDRYNMLKLACDKNEKFMVSSIEIDSKEQAYAIETLEKIEREFNKNVYFILGTDNLRELKTWHKASELIEKYEFIVLARDEDKIEEILEKDELLSKNKEKFVYLKNPVRTNLSSTLVRKMIKENKSIRYLLPEEVLKYISDKKIYD